MTRGTLGVCEPCTQGKAKQKNVPKETEGPPATKDADRLYLDCSTLKDSKTGQVSRKTWRLMVKEWTGLKITDMFPSKNAMVEPTCEKLHIMKQNDRLPKYLRMDNAGENLN